MNLVDPWKFRAFVQTQDTGQVGIRNSLLYLAFPEDFLPIASQQDKKRIRNTFAAEEIGDPTGDDGISVDRDLHAIYRSQSLKDRRVIHYYREPYRSQWSKTKPAPSSERAWLVRDPATGRAAIDEGHVSIVAEHLRDFEPDMDRQALTSAIATGYEHLDYAQRLTLANTYHQFVSTMRVDDLVTAVLGGDLYAGVVAADTELADDEKPRLRRTVNWTPTPLGSLEDLPTPLRTELEQRGTIVDITAAARHLQALMSPAEAPDEIEPAAPSGLLPPTRALADDLHYDLHWLRKLVTVLEDRKQIVLHGPPGTGKTYLARAIARHLTGRDAIRLVQFHPSYTYFELVPGPLRRLAAEAEADKGRPHVLIIDEINRANLAKVFGELYFLPEYRDEKIDLQYTTEEPFKLPDNIYLIGTMNTADRSISTVDAAMRRRFAFVELHPDDNPVHDLLHRWSTANGKTDDRAALLTALNKAIAAKDRDFTIGPSYLMTPEADREGGMDLIWEYSILPLLEQHYHHLGRAEVHATFGLTTIRNSLRPSTT